MTIMKFQSLLSQGISLLRGRHSHGRVSGVRGFNPFLVRASVYCEYGSVFKDVGADAGGFNPFLVRASVYWEALEPQG